MSLRHPTSGPNQHFLPRFLQRGFASAKRGSNPLVWFFTRQGSISQEHINAIGADRYFYGDPAESPVDEVMQKKENQFGALVSELRRSKSTCTIENSLVPEFFAHMAVRTKNLRQVFAGAASQLMQRMAADSDSPEGQARLRRLVERRIDSEISDLLGREPYRWLMSTLQLADRARLKEQLRAHVLNQDFVSVFRTAIRTFSAIVDVDDAASDGHNKALAKLADDVSPRIDALMPLHWSVIVPTDATLILGDIAVMAQSARNQLPESPLKETITPFAVFLPISDHHLLTGSRDSPLLDIDPEVINIASAELSVDFFIASCRSSREEGYLSRLGMRTALFTTSEIDALVRSSIDELR